MSKWYCYSGSVDGPYYNSKAEARANCGPDETARPIHNDVCPDVIDVEGGVVEDETDDDYSEWSHDELKTEAEHRGLADGVDLRSKQPIVDALEADDSGE